MAEPLVLTIEETADLLAIGRTAAYEAARRGEIPTVRIGRCIRVPRHALEQMLTAPGPTPGQENGPVQAGPQKKEMFTTNEHVTGNTR